MLHFVILMCCELSYLLILLGHILYAYIFCIWKFHPGIQSLIFLDKFWGLFVFQSEIWIFSGTCVSVTTSHCCSVGFCIALCVVSALICWAFKVRFVFLLRITRVHDFSGSCVEIIFRLFSLRTKVNEKEMKILFSKILQYFLSVFESV